MKVSIIIPAYNEEKRIGPTLKSYSAYFNGLFKERKLDYELIVVINNTTDKTEEIVKSEQKLNKKIKYLNLSMGGKGNAVITGFKDALKRDSDLIGFVDADMSTSPEEYWRLIGQIRDSDGVIASRGLRGSKVNTSFKRKITNRGFNLIVRLLLYLPYLDTQCGAKIFNRSCVEYVLGHPIRSQWAFDVDLLYILKDKKILEVPTIWKDKADSKVRAITPIKMFSSVVRLRMINSPLRFIVKSYDLLPERIKIHSL